MDHGQGHDFYWQQGARHAHDDWWSGPLHLLVLVLLVALLVAGVVWLVRRLSPTVAQAAVPAAAGAPPLALTADPAIVALRMRYAKGEVSRDDFQHTMEDLTGVVAPTASWPGSEPGRTRHRRPADCVARPRRQPWSARTGGDPETP